MHILLVAPHFPPRFVAGVELYTQRLARWLASRGHAVTVAAAESVDRGGSGPAVRLLSRGVERGVSVLGLALRQSTFRTTFEDPEVEAWWRAHLTESRPDVLHVQSGYVLGGPAMAAARTLRIPSFVTLHDFWFSCARHTLLHPDGRVCSGPESAAKCAWCLQSDRRRIRLADRFTRGGFSRAMAYALESRVVAAATGYADLVEALRRRRLVMREALDSVGAVVSPTRFLADVTRRAASQRRPIPLSPYGSERPPDAVPWIRADGLRVAYLGQVAPLKGVDLAVRAVRVLRGMSVSLTVHGPLDREPQYVAALVALAAQDPRIRFCGAYPREDVWQILAACDVVVVPSRWYENYPFVILEAHAAGRPVVAARHGGMAEMVTDRVDGLLFEPGDARDLARCLGLLATDARLLDDLHRGCRSSRTWDDEFAEIEARYVALAATSE